MNAVTTTFMVTGLCMLNAVSIAATVILPNGDRLSGDIVADSDSVVTIQHPVLGQISVPRSQIAELQADKVLATAEAGAVAVAVTDNGLLGSGWLTDWKRRLEIGVTGAAGKSENMNVSVGFSANYEDEETRWAHRTAFQRNEADGEVSENNLFASLKRDWLHPGSPWFRFADGRFDWDEFKDWDYRVAASGGAGYEFISRDHYRLLGRVGLGANQTVGGAREEFTPEGLIGVDVDWRISPHQSLTFTNNLHPNLRDSGEFRNLMELSWTMDLDRDVDLGLKIGLTNEYDSLAGEDVEKNDFQYTGSLVWGL